MNERRRVITRRLLDARAGFTLIELLVVIVVLAILMAIALPSYLGQREKAQDAGAKEQLTVAYRAAKITSLDSPVQGSYTSTNAASLKAIEPELNFADSEAKPTDTGVINVSLNDGNSLVLITRSGSGKVCTLTAAANGAPDMGCEVVEPASAEPVPIQVSAGGFHTCTLISDGTVKCWGRNTYGQLGDGTSTDSSTPVSVSGITTATQISAGSYLHTCALLSDGTVKCWGNNAYGELGNGESGYDSDGNTIISSTPVSVTGISTAIQIGNGDGNNTCALLSGGTVKCWGYNYSGQLGNGRGLRLTELRLRCDDDPALLARPTPWASVAACTHGLWTPRIERLIRLAEQARAIATLQPRSLFLRDIGARRCAIPAGGPVRRPLAGLCGVSVKDVWSTPTVTFVESWPISGHAHARAVLQVTVTNGRARLSARRGSLPPQLRR